MILRSTDVRSALRSRQRGFLLNPYRFGEAVAFSSVKLHCDGAGLSNGSTTFTDNSTNAFASTLISDPAWSNTKTVFSDVTTRFDGNDALSWGAAADWKFLHDATVPWTLDVQISIDDFASEKMIIDTTNGSSGNAGVFISVNTSGQLRVAITRAVAASYLINYTSSAFWPTAGGALKHLRISWDNTPATGNLNVCFDGITRTSGNKTGNAPSSANPHGALRWGCTTGGAVFLNGYMSCLRITTRALTVPLLQSANWPRS